jgi:protein-S-isoprenylcysteine O-methyltransferase Ste14
VAQDFDYSKSKEGAMQKPVARWPLIVGLLGSSILLAGDTADPWLWAYVLSFAAVSAVALSSMDDDLAKERFSPPEPGADRLSLRLVRLIALAHLGVSLADSRFDWSSVPSAIRAIGLSGFTAGFLAVIYAMRTNRFFSAVVRIQHDRGHRVVDVGPYAWLRHPGYAAMILAVPMSGLALGSWYGALAGCAYSLLILRRVLFEDLYLQQHLDGYREYTQRVPYRLVPGVW